MNNLAEEHQSHINSKYSLHTYVGRVKPIIPNVRGVLFAMRYSDDVGYVWNTIARLRDLAASRLGSSANCFIAYPKLSGTPAYQVQNLHSVELDCHDTSPAALAELEKFIKENSIRVVVFMSALPTTLNMAFFRRLGVATVNTENDGFNHLQKDRLLRKALKYFLRRILKRQIHNLHLANAQAQFDFLRNYAQVPASHLAIMRDAVDYERLIPSNRDDACKLLNIDSERLWIVSVSQARPEKRVSMIIQAVKHVIEARPEQMLGFIFVGDGECAIEWEKECEQLLQADQFHFAGSQDDIVPYYQAASLMAHASRRESFGLAIVEAMSCALPVVATRSAGPNETILDGETGILVDSDDFEGFVQAILKYVDNKQMRKAHGKCARSRVMQYYGIDRQGSEFATHIKRFLGT